MLKGLKFLKIPLKMISLIVMMTLFSLIFSPRSFAQSEPYIFFMVFSPDGSKLVINTSEAINVYDTNFQLLASLPHDDPKMPHYAFSWSPDGTKLKVDANEIYDANTLQLLKTVQSGNWAMGGWNADGTLMDARDPKSVGLVLIDPIRDQIVKHISTEDRYFESFAWSPDNRHFAAFVGKWLVVIGVDEGSIVAEYHLNDFIETLVWTPNSQQVAASLILDTNSSPSYAMDMIDIASGHVTRRIDGLERAPNPLFFSPDGKQLTVVIGTNIIRTWDVQTGQLIDEHIFGTGIRAVDQSPYGGRLMMTIDSSKPLTIPVPPNDNSAALLTSFLDGSLQMIVPAPSAQKLIDTLAFCDLDSATRSTLETLITTQQFQSFVNTVMRLGNTQINQGCKADVLAIADSLIKLSSY